MRVDRHILRAVTALALALVVTSEAPGADIEVSASVTDGDTITIHGQSIRLYGIDAPESAQTCTRAGKPWRCGQQAANALDRKIAGRPVRCASAGNIESASAVIDCEGHQPFEEGTTVTVNGP